MIRVILRLINVLSLSPPILGAQSGNKDRQQQIKRETKRERQQTDKNTNGKLREREASVRCGQSDNPASLSTPGALHVLPRQHIKAGLQSGIK